MVTPPWIGPMTQRTPEQHGIDQANRSTRDEFGSTWCVAEPDGADESVVVVDQAVSLFLVVRFRSGELVGSTAVGGVLFPTLDEDGDW